MCRLKFYSNLLTSDPPEALTSKIAGVPRYSTSEPPEAVSSKALVADKVTSLHGHHQMVNTEIRLIIFFAAKD